MFVIRIGHGYDVHRFAEGRKLILCGVEIPFDKGLLGHSDSDVAIHAVIDALLGAAALPDIGKQFPDNDDRFLNADSTILLKKVISLVGEKGYRALNIDVTIVAQQPKLARYIDIMRSRLAVTCDMDIDCVNVKATTEEGLGFTGAGEGIAVTAVCLITSENITRRTKNIAHELQEYSNNASVSD